MHFYLLPVLAVLAMGSGTDIPAGEVWNQLHARREALGHFHQEFEVTRTFKTAAATRSAKWPVTVDGSQNQWRETSRGGSGTNTRVFDGKNIFTFEEGENEYVRTKPSTKDGALLPSPYDLRNADWSKAIERERKSCGLSNVDHQCVVLDVPLKPWIKNRQNETIRMLHGTERVVLDTETGLLLSTRTIQIIENPGGGYQSDVTYVVTRMTYGPAKDETLFRLPSADMKEVKGLTRWNAAKINKLLGGKPAPEFTFTDLQGKQVALSAYKGKTVLLDFWATWCGPCRADAPALDQLYEKYSGKDLMIIGVSVDEDRAIVEKFLSKHPHPYPIVLTTENEMPRAYQIGVFPTYIVIDADGNVATATEGDKGFASLRKLLQKAGLEIR